MQHFKQFVGLLHVGFLAVAVVHVEASVHVDESQDLGDEVVMLQLIQQVSRQGRKDNLKTSNMAEGSGSKISEINRSNEPPYAWISYLEFFGFWSFSLDVSVWEGCLMNAICLLLCTYCRVLLPYLLGAFGGSVLLCPVLTALKTTLAHYNYDAYSLGMAYPAGLSNAVTFFMVQRKWITQRQRWLFQALGWTLIMTGMPVLSIACGFDIDDYKFSPLQLMRCSTSRLSLYLFIFYGLCNQLEPWALSETGKALFNKEL